MSMPLFSQRAQGVFYLRNDFIFNINIKILSDAADRSAKSPDRTDLNASGPGDATKKLHPGRAGRPEHLKTKISTGAIVLHQCNSFIAFCCFPKRPDGAFYI
jgi:hypothetical protein